MRCGAEFNVFRVCPKTDLDDQIFACLHTSMAAVLAGDVLAYFLSMSDLNCHHEQLMSYTIMIVSSTLAGALNIDLMVTDIP